MDLINEIRSANGALGSHSWLRAQADPSMKSTLLNLRENLHCASQRFSEDLYSKDSHFLLELIQNADDNTYDADVTPTLQITLDPNAKTLAVACNESGFKEDQVRALCKIGNSTKKHRQGYIGEKGIGFKSVFKVADVVSISSGPYKFKFDKRDELGMITPTWMEDCPGRSNWTQFTLYLSNTVDLESNISNIDPTLLLFLRKLRSLELQTDTTRLVLEREDKGPNIVCLHRLHAGSDSPSRVLLVKEFVEPHSAERRRPDILGSEVILAFPLELDDSPKVGEQYVHAFLPIRKYGFHFLIQGDFLTCANREGILWDPVWNKTIRGALVSVFLKALPEFQSRPNLKFGWHRYLPRRSLQSGFFNPFKNALIAKLRTTKVLYSADGRLRCPSQLFAMSSDHLGADGTCLIAEDCLGGFHYLSSEYDLSNGSASILHDELGVRHFTNSDFISALTRMSPGAIQSQSTTWQESVCSLLRKLTTTAHRQAIMALPMVPLQDGSWATLGSGNLFFSSDIVDIPSDLCLRVLEKLDPSSSRFSLFHELGVKRADPAAISEAILNLHALERPSTDHVLSHAHFLFVHQGQYGNLSRLKALNQEGALVDATELYMDGGEQGIMHISYIISSQSRLLHNSYLTPPPSRLATSWHAWLRNELRVNVFPRVTSGKFSPEFLEFLTDPKSNSARILHALKDYWPRLKSGVTSAAVKALGEQISVTCEGGALCSLSATALRRGQLRTFSHLQFLLLEDPESEAWNFLEEFGVTTRPDGLLYLKWLHYLNTENSSDLETITSIYKQLEVRFEDGSTSSTLIRRAFNKNRLIFVRKESHPGPNAQWLSKHDVVWGGPPSMRSKVDLGHFYPQLTTFFRNQLQIQPCPDDVLLTELIELARSSSLSSVISSEAHSRVCHLLGDISTLIKQRTREKAPIPPWISQLATYPIFPVRLASTKELQLRKLDETFYIPDKSGKFFKLFGDRVDILEFIDEIPLSTIRPLLLTDHFRPHFETRYLDAAVSSRSSAAGQRFPEAGIQKEYLKRAHLIRRLLHAQYSRSDKSKGDLLQEKFQKLVVFRARSILTTYTIDELDCTQNEDLIIEDGSEDQPNCFVILISTTCKPSGHSLLFGGKLASICGLDKDDLSWVMCTLPEIGEQYLESRGIGAQFAGTTRETMIPSATTSEGRTTARSKTARTSFPYDSDSIQPVVGSSGSGALATFLGQSMQMISDAADRQSLSPGQFPISTNILTVSARKSGISTSSRPTPASGGYEAHSTSSTLDTLNNSSTSKTLSGGLHGGSNVVAHSPAGSSPSITPAEYENGVLGELFIFKILLKRLPGFTADNWISELRGVVPNFSPYMNFSSSVADFQYFDTQGDLTKAIFGNDIYEAWRDQWPEYHIEVKTTSDQEGTPFYMSSRQLQLARKFTLRKEDQIPAAVYVLARVWNIRSPSAAYTWCPDPHHGLFTGRLKIASDKVEIVLEHA